MAKLTDTQLIILSAAAQRDDRGVELPANVQGKAARKIVDKLIRAGLLEEDGAGGSLPVWRRDGESGAIALTSLLPLSSAVKEITSARTLRVLCGGGQQHELRIGEFVR
jgi:hypothetical protein